MSQAGRSLPVGCLIYPPRQSIALHDVAEFYIFIAEKFKHVYDLLVLKLTQIKNRQEIEVIFFAFKVVFNIPVYIRGNYA
jgi:hypothetical protein